jgi:hypothetical protein
VKRTSTWKALERFVQGPQGASVIPVLGSGFVTQAVMEGASESGTKSPRPVDWYSLLEGVAREFRCSAATTHIVRDVPGQTTLLWDAMVAELAQRSPHASAHAWEAKLRRAVAKRLREDEHTLHLSRGFVQSFLEIGWHDVMSFNFDRALLAGGARPSYATTGRSRRVSLSARVGGTRVWFPHGHQSDPSSIVLGAHAYGVRIAAMQAAFEAHARKPAPRPTEALDTWVAAALERPLLFVGLSLTREEWTLWWLLTQRARYLARRPAARRPPAFVFARRPLPARAPRDARRLPEPGAGLRAARSLAARLHRVCDRVAGACAGALAWHA